MDLNTNSPPWATAGDIPRPPRQKGVGGARHPEFQGYSSLSMHSKFGRSHVSCESRTEQIRREPQGLSHRDNWHGRTFSVFGHKGLSEKQLPKTMDGFSYSVSQEISSYHPGENFSESMHTIPKSDDCLPAAHLDTRAHGVEASGDPVPRHQGTMVLRPYGVEAQRRRQACFNLHREHHEGTDIQTRHAAIRPEASRGRNTPEDFKRTRLALLITAILPMDWMLGGPIPWLTRLRRRVTERCSGARSRTPPRKEPALFTRHKTFDLRSAQGRTGDTHRGSACQSGYKEGNEALPPRPHDTCGQCEKKIECSSTRFWSRNRKQRLPVPTETCLRNEQHSLLGVLHDKLEPAKSVRQALGDKLARWNGTCVCKQSSGP